MHQAKMHYDVLSGALHETLLLLTYLFTHCWSMGGIIARCPSSVYQHMQHESNPS